ncbi:hypothetical protein [Streptomyces sp. NPDC059893]|uniref:hypothetical protein n=1 Tax=Streptomyces sp. NPDC059893 TaxID=3346990 RepID=UPI00366327C8
MSTGTDRTLTRDDTAEQAQERAFQALAAILESLGAGRHRLSYAAQRTTGELTVQDATADVRHTAQGMRLTGSPCELSALHGALTAGLEGSAVRSCVLIARTQRAGDVSACGWSLRGGWLHAMPVASLTESLRPCPGVQAPPTVIRQAPELPQPRRP